MSPLSRASTGPRWCRNPSPVASRLTACAIGSSRADDRSDLGVPESACECPCHALTLTDTARRCRLVEVGDRCDIEDHSRPTVGPPVYPGCFARCRRSGPQQLPSACRRRTLHVLGPRVLGALDTSCPSQRGRSFQSMQTLNMAGSTT